MFCDHAALLNDAARGAFFSNPLDGVVEIILSGFVHLYPTYELY